MHELLSGLAGMPSRLIPTASVKPESPSLSQGTFVVIVTVDLGSASPRLWKTPSSSPALPSRGPLAGPGRLTQGLGPMALTSPDAGAGRAGGAADNGQKTRTGT